MKEYEGDAPEKAQCWAKRASSPLIAESDVFFQDHKRQIATIVTPNSQLVAASLTGHGRLILGCVDEGVRDDTDLSALGIDGTFHVVHAIGSGILHPNVVADLSRNITGGVYGITSHEECGGAALKAKAVGLENADTVGEEFARNLAQQQNTRYLGAIPLRSMKRPESFHGALGVYFDGTSRLDQTKSAYLPTDCFTLTAPLFGQKMDAAESELQTIASIALSSNSGYGLAADHEHFGFSPEAPFYIFVVGQKFQTRMDLHSLVTVAQSVAQTNPNIRVVGFEAP